MVSRLSVLLSSPSAFFFDFMKVKKFAHLFAIGFGWVSHCAFQLVCDLKCKTSKTAYVGLVHSNIQFNKFHAESKSTARFFNKNKQSTIVPMRPVSIVKLCGQTRVKHCIRHDF